MKTLWQNYLSFMIRRVLTVALTLSALFLGTWSGKASAEILTSVYVNGSGYVGNAITTGSNCSGATCVYGNSTSSTNLYRLYVNTRHWHLVSYSQPEIEMWAEDYYVSSTSGTSMAYVTGDPTTSFHSYQSGVWDSPSSAFTSYPDGSASSYSWWACGRSSC